MDISQKEKVYGLSMIWKDAEYSFPFWNRLTDLEWDSEYLSSLDAVSQTLTLKNYYLELMKFISLLNDGHTYIEFPKEVYDETKQYPIKLKYKDEKHIIVGIDKRYNIPLLSEVYSINNIPINQYLDEQILPYCWHSKKTSAFANLYSLWPLGNKGFSTNAYSLISFIDENNSINISTSSGNFTLFREDERLVWDEIYLKPRIDTNDIIYTSDFLEVKITSDNIGIITIPTFLNDNMPKTFYSLLNRLKSCKGFLIDVRNNAGGNSANADAICQSFIRGKFETGRVKHLIHIGAYWAWGKGLNFENLNLTDPFIKKVYEVSNKSLFEDEIQSAFYQDCPLTLDQPIVILENTFTSSSAENFLINFDNVNRATIVGTSSYGSTGNPLICNLPGGGKYRICTRRYTYPNGKEFIGTGIEPHVKIDNNINDLMNGTDRVFEYGLKYLREKIDRQA